MSSGASPADFTTADELGHEFSVEHFRRSGQTDAFSCGDPDLDEFLSTEEVETYAKTDYGYTYLVFWRGTLIAYYTTCMSSLPFKYLDLDRTMGAPNFLQSKPVPSILLGRLAVQEEFQGKKVGRWILNKIVLDALDQDQYAVRLLILNATPGAIDFYTRYGFAEVVHRNMHGRREKDLYFDLHYVRPLIFGDEE